MDMLRDRILTVNLVGSTLIFYAAARIYLLPRIKELRFQAVMPPILLLHSFRHLGLMFLASGAVSPGMPAHFAYPAAIGDLVAAILAFAAIPATLRNLPAGRYLVWMFNIEGSVDLIAAIILATVYGAPAYMGAAYWIPAFWVPALLVTHYIVFLVLTRAGSPVLQGVGRVSETHPLRKHGLRTWRRPPNRGFCAVIKESNAVRRRVIGPE